MDAPPRQPPDGPSQLQCPLSFGQHKVYLHTIPTCRDHKHQIHCPHQTYNHDNEELRCGVLDGSTPSAAANSRATSSVGTKQDSKHFISTRQQSDKIFRLPNGATEPAIDIGHLSTAVRSPARDIYITPGIDKTSLISSPKQGTSQFLIATK